MKKEESASELKNFEWGGFEKNIYEFPLIMSKNKMTIKWNSKISGIYIWLNMINGKMYVGRGNNLYRRVYDEKRAFKNGKHENLKKLFNAVNKYGIHNFEVRELIRVDDRNKLLKLEECFVAYFDTKNGGYNCTYGGEGTTGHIVTQKQIEKQKQKMKEYWTEERKKEHTEKMKKWYGTKTDVEKRSMEMGGSSWLNNPESIKKFEKNYKKSLTIEKIKRQKKSINNYYRLNGGKQIRYKGVTLYSPNNKSIFIDNIPSFCKKNNFGKIGFYNFLKKKDTDRSFRGWKLISVVV